MELAQVLGYIATALFTVCYIPQLIKTYKTGTVEGLSFLLLFISFIANIVALWYATLIEQPPLQIKYVFAMIFLAACIGLYLHTYRKSTLKLSAPSENSEIINKHL